MSLFIRTGCLQVGGDSCSALWNGSDRCTVPQSLWSKLQSPFLLSMDVKVWGIQIHIRRLDPNHGELPVAVFAIDSGGHFAFGQLGIEAGWRGWRPVYYQQYKFRYVVTVSLHNPCWEHCFSVDNLCLSSLCSRTVHCLWHPGPWSWPHWEGHHPSTHFCQPPPSAECVSPALHLARGQISLGVPSEDALLQVGNTALQYLTFNFMTQENWTDFFYQCTLCSIFDWLVTFINRRMQSSKAENSIGKFRIILTAFSFKTSLCL